MRVSEKSLELNVGAEILNRMRTELGMPKAYLRGLTQREESREGFDFSVQLNPTTRVYAYQFKAPKGQSEDLPYLFTLKREQHSELFRLAVDRPESVFYVFPFYATPQKLQQDVPNLAADTWLLDINTTPTDQIFNGQNSTTVYCERGLARVNPEYKMISVPGVKRLAGVPAKEFAEWYSRFREKGHEEAGRRSSWLSRGLRVAIAPS